MRRVLAYDIDSAVQGLMGYPEAEWSGICNAWIRKADIAHRYFKHFGRPHPFWGRGSLADVVGEGCKATESRCRYSAYETVFHCLVRYRTRLA